MSNKHIPISHEDRQHAHFIGRAKGLRAEGKHALADLFCEIATMWAKRAEENRKPAA